MSRPGAAGLRFGMFAVCVSRDSDAGLNSGKAKPLYDLLVSFADVGSRDTGQGYPYREALASCLDCSKQTVDRAADYLEKEIGLVKVHRRKVEGKPDENDANRYEIFDAWLIHGVPPPVGTPPQLVARYGHTVPGLDIDAWVSEHAPDFDLGAWRAAYDETLRAQEAKREEQRRKERARRKPKKKGGGVTHDATPQGAESGGGSVMGDATGGVTHDATGGVMGDALSTTVPPEPSSTTDPAPAARSAADARRASAGSSACERAKGGSAASGQDDSSSEGQSAAGTDVPKQRAEEPEGQELTGDQAARVKAVVASLPAALVALLPYGTLPRRSRRQWLESMGARTTEQIIDRVARRWEQHGYADALHSIDGKGIGRAVGVAMALVRAGECPHPRCEDGHDIDSRTECRACAERRADRRAAKKAAAAAGRTTGAVRQAQHRPGWWECTICHTPDKGQAPDDGECTRCQDEAAAAAQQLADRWAQEAADLEAEQQAAADLSADLDRQAEEHSAAEAAERTAQQQADAEKTERIRAELAEQYPELAAVSGSTSPTSPPPF
ncbi:hypothetical protein [Streptomyces sp. NPDC005989]|uniref:hypothetical protein n=1 Tax=Streptomyces sp. NPDC005989 TaxID=3156727 RepID=UPI0033C483F3